MTKALVNDIVTSFLQRFLADGVHYRDLMDISAASPDWHHNRNRSAKCSLMNLQKDVKSGQEARWQRILINP